MNTYEPRQGTIAAAILTHLRSQPAHQRFSRQELAEATKCSADSLSVYLGPAMKAGIVHRVEGADGRVAYSLTPGDAFEADERRGGKPLHHAVAAQDAPAIGKVGRTSVFDVADESRPPPSGSGFKRWLSAHGEASAEGRAPRRRRSNAAVVQPVAPAAQPPDVVLEAEAPALCCALFNTGDLVLEAAGTSMRLSARQAADLVRYLKRVHPDYSREIQ